MRKSAWWYERVFLSGERFYTLYWWPKGRIRSGDANSREATYAQCIRFCTRHKIAPPSVGATPSPEGGT